MCPVKYDLAGRVLCVAKPTGWTQVSGFVERVDSMYKVTPKASGWLQGWATVLEYLQIRTLHQLYWSTTIKVNIDPNRVHSVQCFDKMPSIIMHIISFD